MIGNESLNIRGALTIQKKTRDNEIVEEVRVNNSITTAGRDLVAKLFDFNSELKDMKRVSKIGIGTGSAAFKPGDTKLQKLLDYTKIITVDPKEVLEGVTPRKQLIITGELKEDECNAALTEAGLFTEDDIMYNRVVFAPINKSNNFKLTLIWEITF